MRRLRYWLALKLVPELAAYANPSARLFARATRDMLRAEMRYIDPKVDATLREIGG